MEFIVGSIAILILSAFGALIMPAAVEIFVLSTIVGLLVGSFGIYINTGKE